MMNNEWWIMNNCGIPSWSIKTHRRRRYLHYSLFPIPYSLFIPHRGRDKKYPSPDKNQGWDTKYSTVPPWLQHFAVTHWRFNGRTRSAISGRRLRSGIILCVPRSLAPTGSSLCDPQRMRVFLTACNSLEFSTNVVQCQEKCSRDNLSAFCFNLSPGLHNIDSYVNNVTFFYKMWGRPSR